MMMLSVALIKTASAMAGLVGLAVAAFLHVSAPALDEPEMRRVVLPSGGSLLVAVHEVTRRDWQACVAEGACEALPQEVITSAADMPMTGVNHLDVEAYLQWLNASAGRRYRLPTAEEWQAIAAELPHKPFKKLYDDPRLAWAADYGSMEAVSAVVRPSGAFGTFSNGIADLSGNVWEWTSTCTLKGAEPERCPAYLAEGLHEAAVSVFVRDPAVGGCALGTPPANIGFRLVAG
jgi:formylglycine-generating enzyme required for sulfatase activity